jgi:transcriptional regulator with XRE-family HTH domain
MKRGDNMTVANKDILSKNLKKHIYKSGKDRNTIAEELNLSYSTLTDWVNGKKYPRINNIEKLAAYFNVSKADLIEDFEEIKKDNDALATIIVKLRMNKELLNVVEKLLSLDKAKLESLNRFLDTFV